MEREYREYLIERFQGEVYGEALFRSLAERAADDARGYKWRVLEQLERETKERIRSALTELETHPIEDAERIDRGRRHGERFSNTPWLEFMKAFRSEVEKLVAVFEAAETLAPEQGKLREILRHITTHERALLEFAAREIDGDGETSLHSVVALLRSPPAR